MIFLICSEAWLGPHLQRTIWIRLIVKKTQKGFSIRKMLQTQHVHSSKMWIGSLFTRLKWSFYIMLLLHLGLIFPLHHFWDTKQLSQYSWREELDLGERRVIQTPAGDCYKGFQRSRNINKPLPVGQWELRKFKWVHSFQKWIPSVINHLMA